jgi:sporulation protein YlmC with PRC-barrel domain
MECFKYNVIYYPFSIRGEMHMKINNPQELVGKPVVDTNGNPVGTIDKAWNSWNHDYPGFFFGIKPNKNTRDTWFRGTYKLIPIYSDYIREVHQNVTLNKTAEELGRFWNKTVPCGQTTCPTDELVEMPVYDKNYSRVGTFYTWVESDGMFKNYGVFLDPFLCDQWKIPMNTIMPLEANYLWDVKSQTICLDKTLDELKEYWKSHHQYQF